MMLWLLDHPNVEQSLLSPDEIDQLVNHDFEDYYSTYAASHFALQVWINNAWVAALCIAFGILGLPVIYLLFNNIANLAVIGSIMHRHDHGQQFWGLILPHGLLELTAVFVAGGVGLRLFWSWIEPGELTRTQSIAREGRTAGTVALGLVGVLMVSGLDRGVRDAVRAADLGPGRHRHHRRGWPSSPTSSCSAGRPTTVAPPATSTAATSRTGSPPRRDLGRLAGASHVTTAVYAVVCGAWTPRSCSRACSTWRCSPWSRTRTATGTTCCAGCAPAG